MNFIEVVLMPCGYPLCTYISDFSPDGECIYDKMYIRAPEDAQWRASSRIVPYFQSTIFYCFCKYQVKYTSLPRLMRALSSALLFLTNFMRFQRVGQTEKVIPPNVLLAVTTLVITMKYGRSSRLILCRMNIYLLNHHKAAFPLLLVTEKY